MTDQASNFIRPGARLGWGMEKSRIAALVDGIFAVAMTLLVLDLKLPETVKISTDAEVWQQLLGLQGRFSTYALSFLILGSYWVVHHSLFHFVRRVNRNLLWINLIFLLFATLVPFSTNLLSNRSNLHIPVVVFGINLLLMSSASLLQLRYLVRHPELSHDQFTPQWIVNAQRRTAIPAVIAAASIAISFYAPNLGSNVYWLMLVIHLLPGQHHHPPSVKD